MRVSGSIVAVTGASGLLGSHIVRALVDAGAKVRAVVRNLEKSAFLGPLGVELAKADLLEPASLQAAFRTADAVVSCAALWTMRLAPWPDFYQANVVGTENVFTALGGAGVRRAIHISTFGVYRWRLFSPMDEETPRLDGARRQGGAYRATKSLSEDKARELGARFGVDLTVLRPTGIYGARDPHLWPKVRPLVKLPLAPAPTLSFPLVYAGDVARAVVGALENEASVGQAYNTGGDDVPFSAFVRALKRAHPEARGVVVPLPVPLKVRVSNAKAARDLGFRNRSFEEGLARSFADERAGRI